MKIAAIGDPHGDLEKIRKIPLDGVDLILLTGDLGQADILRKQAMQFLAIQRPSAAEKKACAQGFRQAFQRYYDTSLETLRYLAGKSPMLIVRGNADLSNYDVRKFSRTFGIALPLLYQGLLEVKSARLLDNRLAVINGLRIGGVRYFADMCWVEEFELSGVEKIRKRAERETQSVGLTLGRFGRVDILLSHIPPYGVLDRVDSDHIPPSWVGRHAGSRLVLDYIKRQHPRYAICGHIHESAGMETLGNTEVFNLGSGGHKLIEL
jgi:Icc-related predicted phosphoesterase